MWKEKDLSLITPLVFLASVQILQYIFNLHAIKSLHQPQVLFQPQSNNKVIISA